MKHLYPNYSFDVTSTLVGAAGFATKDLPMNFLKIDIENIRQTCRICQEKALIDSTGNCETYKKKKIYQRLPSEHRVQYRNEFDVSGLHVIPMLSSK